MNWQDVQGLRKAGEFREAVDLASELLASGPDRKVRTQLDWSWYGLIRGQVDQMVKKLKASESLSSEDISCLVGNLRGYAKQPAIRPDNPLSNVLREVSKVASHLPQFPGFMRWVGIDGLAIEDWQYQSRNGKVYRPVAMGAARGLAKWVKAHPDAESADIELARDWLDRIRPAAQDDDALWLDWDRALMLRRLGELGVAAETLGSVLKAKRSEFWVWAEAARLYADEQPELALACYCRALSCGSEPKFTVNVHRELAELLGGQEDYAQASREVALAIEIREQQDWKIDPALQQLIDSSWYDPANGQAEDAKAYYARHSADALVLCFDHVETRAATFLGILTPRPPDNPPPGWKPRPLSRFAVLDQSGHSTSLVGPGLRRVKYKLGAPLTVVIGRQDGDTRETILQVASRPEGTPWDCTASGAGLVMREMTADKPMYVYMDRDHDNVPVNDAWVGPQPARLGEGTRFRFAENPKNGRKDLFMVEPGPLPDDDVKLVRGRLTRNAKGFGFIEDAFVPPHVVATVPANAEDVAALLVYAKHPKTGQYSWRAVKLSTA